ncbi:hypothetical protein J4E82_002745 [Alternaria postmessia]|nr:uncharacterized protein J4E82_002745 [Alternaria postmessia]KAI5378432.1 hypothetical protein J4E82_002745 [Alternaria postmessia]
MTLDPADQKSPSPKRIDTTPTTLLHHYRNLYISFTLTTATMPPKQMAGKGRTLNEPSFASSTISAFTSKENRSIVTAAGMFAVRYSMRWQISEGR